MGFEGVGLSYRREFEPFFGQLIGLIDCLEIMFEETYLDDDDPFARAIPLPKIGHAVSLSPAAAPLDLPRGFTGACRAMQSDGIELLGDHLSFSSAGGISINNFLPPVMCEEEVDRIAGNVKKLASEARLPFVLENPVTFLSSPNDTLSAEAMLGRISEQADCGILLDVNNLYVQARNTGLDPYACLAALPAGRIVYVHVAGHRSVGGLLLDSHDQAMTSEVMNLAEIALCTTAARAVVLERDNASAERAELVDELGRLRDLWDRTHRR